MEQKKMKWIMIAIVAVVAALLVFILVTTSKSARIKKLEKFTLTLEEKHPGYSASDLEKSQAQFEKIVAKVEKKELTGEEVSHVNELKGECKGYFAQAKARLILQDFNNALDEAGDEVKGALKSITGEDE